jgi:energy-coupling factor transport system ATP-binding protein
MVFQNPDRQIFAGRVRAEVEFGPRILGRAPDAVRDAATAALLAVGLDAFEEANPYDLGFSRRKLLTLASVLAMDTPVVVLDEPAISHDMRFVAETFGRVVVMASGRVVLDGTPAEVFAEAAWPTLASTYLEPPLASRVGARLGLGATPTETSLVDAMAASRS